MGARYRDGSIGDGIELGKYPDQPGKGGRVLALRTA